MILRQGDIRYWYPGVPGIDGMKVKICGFASAPVVVVGRGYIVELLEPISNYEYSHATALEIHLK